MALIIIALHPMRAMFGTVRRSFGLVRRFTKPTESGPTEWKRTVMPDQWHSSWIAMHSRWFQRRHQRLKSLIRFQFEGCVRYSVICRSLRSNHDMRISTATKSPRSTARRQPIVNWKFYRILFLRPLNGDSLIGQVRKNSIPRRERYVEDWEIEEALTVASPMLRAYVVLKLLTALRRGDLLRLRTVDLHEDGISVMTSKTGKKLIIVWTDELREAVDAAIQARTKDIVPWIFCTRTGDCYVNDDGTANAFDSLWQRFMKRVIYKTKVSDRFQEKDLRKKTASDMGLEAAQKLLGHTTAMTTERHYRITAEKVKPHSLSKA